MNTYGQHHKRSAGLTLPAGLVLGLALLLFSAVAAGEKQKVDDLKYGVVLFDFYQHKYFEALVEFEYADARGGIVGHGRYPELLKGGVSLSYGLDRQARDIFSALIAENTTQETQNRAWYFLAKMLYQRGDVSRAAENLNQIHGQVPTDIEQEYRYLATLVNIKLGQFDAAEAISKSFDKNSNYAPYLYFNLGVALGHKGQYERAIKNLQRVTDFVDENESSRRLADRAHMAIAFLLAEQNQFAQAYQQIRNVSVKGVYSNRALLGSGWASVNGQDYREALAPLTVLQNRSIAIPEVQEAVLLVPHVYEKLGVKGRAARGFISAYDRYGDALTQVSSARETLKEADVLELFVKNLDEMLGDSDWFGTAPAVSLNSLSPFLFELMSDHSFQSVLKELRDLYAIRNNLKEWKQKRDDFNLILSVRTRANGTAASKPDLDAYSEQRVALDAKAGSLRDRIQALNEDDRQRLTWLLDEIQDDLSASSTMIRQLKLSETPQVPVSAFQLLVNQYMDSTDVELDKTEKLIDKVESVMMELVNAELDVHEERIKYYRVQSHLAKVRILDRTLSEYDEPAPSPAKTELGAEHNAIPLSEHSPDGLENDDAS